MDIRIKETNIKFKIRASAVIVVNNKILVEKYNEESYCLPGGYVKIGETSKTAMKREIEEELSFKVTINKFLGLVESFFVNNKKENTHEITFYYSVSPVDLSDVTGENFNLTEDDNGYIIHHHFEWLDVTNLNKCNLKPNFIIDKIISNNDKMFHIVSKD